MTKNEHLNCQRKIGNRWFNELADSFPLSLIGDIKSIDALPLRFYYEPRTNYSGTSFILENEGICIPSRTYINEIDFESCTAIQQLILSCYYTRDLDGYIREKYLRKIIRHQQAWVVPYVMLLLGEYVIEILDVIYANLDMMDLQQYTQFILENNDFYLLTKQRMISYWDCYYRLRYPIKENYVGFKIISHLDTNLKKTRLS